MPRLNHHYGEPGRPLDFARVVEDHPTPEAVHAYEQVVPDLGDEVQVAAAAFSLGSLGVNVAPPVPSVYSTESPSTHLYA